ncbi:Ribosomal subunit interface protein [hydrothermal vent metagenome]|uniref:Ribosomal subunit interface protein n=1 Tax=hydrothermal vent metagenome TaxID=652676 RepID=A0A1W1D4I8_9ZZZZ
MNTHIRAKDITLSDFTKQHIENAISAFSKYHLDITGVDVNITKEKNEIHVEFNIHIAHSNPVVINQMDAVLDAAIDLAIDRAKNALSKLHDKVKHKDRTSIKDIENI